MATKAKAATLALKPNEELWNYARSKSPSFASHTAEGTAELFTERGWATVNQANFTTIMNEFWDIMMPYSLGQVNISHARDPLADADFGESYGQEWGEYQQRLAIPSVKPITPAYRNLENGMSIDPFIVRKIEPTDRYFGPNFDYQSMITMPDEWTTKRIFTSRYGFSEFLAGIYQGLENGYIIQKYENKLEALNQAIKGDPRYPLQSGQTVTTGMPALQDATEEDIVNFVISINDTIEAMTYDTQTSAFNAYKFASVQDPSRLRLLLRPGWKTRMNSIVKRNSRQLIGVDFDVKTVTVPHFGGLIPQYNGATVYPTYDKLGERTGWSTTQGGEASLTDEQITYVDPNADVIGILADKAFLFEIARNPYRVEMIRNPRGLYTNAFASAPNNAIRIDPLYNMVIFK
ncbi:MAG: hypothetical protein HDS66_05850 [Bacteroidales bacterium]|nr:hypothetical protein [Bacteroidales bacterium]